jgi:hypothetical protein
MQHHSLLFHHLLLWFRQEEKRPVFHLKALLFQNMREGRKCKQG